LGSYHNFLLIKPNYQNYLKISLFIVDNIQFMSQHLYHLIYQIQMAKYFLQIKGNSFFDMDQFAN